MANEKTVLTVQLVADTKDFNDKFAGLTQTAKGTGNAISAALVIDNRAALSRLGEINDRLLLLQSTAIKVGKSLQDSMNLPTQNNSAVRQAKATFEAMSQQASKVAQISKAVSADAVRGSLNSVTQLAAVGRQFGQTSRGFEDTFKRIDRSIGGMFDSIVSNSRRGGVEIGKNLDTLRNSLKKAPEDNRKLLGDAQTVTRNAAIASQPTISIRGKGDSNAAGSINLASQAAEKAALDRMPSTISRTRSDVNAGATPNIVTQNTIKELEKVEKATGATVGRIAATASTAGQQAATGFVGKFKGIVDGIQATGEKGLGVFGRFFRASFFGDLAANLVRNVLGAFKAITTETVLYAARTEELGVALESLARVNDISTRALTEQEVVIKRLNITTQDTKETLARFINVGFDIGTASPLARVAQDLAVIGGLSTSEELNKLVVGIQTLQSRNLRSAGVFITVDEVLDKLSATTGRARDSFSTLEKQQAVLSAVLEYGAKVAGTYEAAMGTASKQLRSLERQFYEAQNAIGKGFVPVLAVGVTAVGKLLDTIARFPGIFLGATYAVTAFSAAMILLKTNVLIGIGTSLAGVLDSIKGVANSSLGANFITAQQTQNALKVQSLTLEQSTLQAKLAQLAVDREAVSAQLAKAKTGQVILTQTQQNLAASKLQNITDKEAALTKKVAANSTIIANGGVAPLTKGEQFVAAAGKIALIGTAAVIAYQSLSALRDIAEAPYIIKSLDTSAALKNALDLKEIETNRIELQRISNIQGEVSFRDEQKILEIHDNFNIGLRAELQLRDRKLQQQGESQKLAKDELALLDQQRVVLEEQKRAKTDQAVTNFERASKNLAASAKEVREINEAIKLGRKEAAQGFKTSYSAQIGASLTDGNKGILRNLSQVVNSTIGGLADTTIDTLGLKGDLARDVVNSPLSFAGRAAQNKEYFESLSIDKQKEYDEFQAVLKSTVNDLDNLRKSYGAIDVRRFIEDQKGVTTSVNAAGQTINAYGDVVDKTSTVYKENVKQAQELIDKYEELRAEAVRAAAATAKVITDGTLAGDLKSAGGGFAVERKNFIKTIDDELKNSARNEAEKERIRNERIKLYDFGFANPKQIEEKKEKITGFFNVEQQRSFIKEGRTRGPEEIQKALAIAAEDARIQLELSSRGLADYSDNAIEAFQGTIQLSDSIGHFQTLLEFNAVTARDNETALLGMTSALSKANTEFKLFQTRDTKTIANDIKAAQLDRGTRLGQTYESNAGELGISPDVIKQVIDEGNRRTGDKREQFFKDENRFLEGRKKIKDIQDQITDAQAYAENTELQAGERRLEVAQALQNLTKARNPNQELEIINRQIALAQAQEKQRQVKDPALSRYDNLIKITDLETQIYELHNKDTGVENLERRLKIETEIKAFADQRKAVEDEIAVLKVTSTLPAISAELLAQKTILQSVVDRRQAEKQLTADIAVEVDKRTRYNLNSADQIDRMIGEVFLERQKGEREGQESLLKSVIGLEYSRGNTDVFTNNPAIKEAVKQSAELEKIKSEGGVQTLILNRTNEILEQKVTESLNVGNQLTNLSNQKIEAVNTSMSTGFTNLIAAVGQIQIPTGFGTEVSGPALSSNEAAKFAMQFFLGKGYSKAQSAGIVGNLQTESGNFAPDVVAGQRRGDGGKAVGVAQWHPDRQARFAAIYGRSIIGAPLPQQLDFIDRELKTTERGAGGRLAQATTPAQAAAIVDQFYERSSGQHRGQRIANANNLAGLNVTGAPATPIGKKPVVKSVAAEAVKLVKDQNKAVELLQTTANKAVGPEKDKALRALNEYRQKIEEAETRSRQILVDRLAQITGSERQLAEFTLIETQAAQEIVGILENNAQAKENQVQIYREINAQEINLIEKSNELSKYLNELSEESNFGNQRRNTRAAINADRIAELGTVGSEAQTKVQGEYYLKLQDEIIARKTRSIELDFKSTNAEVYRYNLATKSLDEFNMSLKEQDQTLDEREAKLNLSIVERGRILQNVLREENIARREASEALNIQIAQEEELRDFYIGSTAQVLDLQKQANIDRLKSHNETITEIIKLEQGLGYTQEGMIERLRLKQVQVNDARKRELEDALGTQIELTDRINNADDPRLEAARNRNKLLTIAGEAKSTGDAIGDFYADMFKSVSSGLDGLIDKSTAKMGIFGNAIGGLLKSLINRPIQILAKTIADKLYPQDAAIGAATDLPINPKDIPQVSQIMIGNELTKDTNSILGRIEALLGQKGLQGEGTGVAFGGDIPGLGLINKTISLVSKGGFSLASTAFTTAKSLATTNKSYLGALAAPPSVGPNGLATNFFGGGPSRGSFAQDTITPDSLGPQSPSLARGTGIGLTGLSDFGTGNNNNTTVIPPTPPPPPTRGGATDDPIAQIGAKGRKLPQGPSFGRGLAGAGIGAGASILSSIVGGLGGTSTTGNILGGIASTIVGIGGAAVGGAIAGGASLGGLLGSSSSIGLFGLSGAATLGIGAAIVGALALGSYLFGRSKRRKEEKAAVTKATGDAIAQLQTILKAVKSDKTDGDSALAAAQDIRKQFVEATSQLKTGPGKAQAKTTLGQIDGIIGQIKTAGEAQTRRRETDAKLIPTYAKGGFTTHEYARVSRGEKLIFPQNLGRNTYRIPGEFDRKDDILMRLPVGTQIQNPIQQHYAAIRGYASGTDGVGQSYTSVAPGNITVAPIIQAKVIVVFSEEDANKLVASSSGQVITQKVTQTVRANGKSGLVNAIAKEMASY